MIIYNWLAEFKRGHINLSDEIRDGRPSTAVNNKNVDAVRRMIETDTHVALSRDSDILRHRHESNTVNPTQTISSVAQQNPYLLQARRKELRSKNERSHLRRQGKTNVSNTKKNVMIEISKIGVITCGTQLILFYIFTSARAPLCTLAPLGTCLVCLKDNPPLGRGTQSSYSAILSWQTDTYVFRRFSELRQRERGSEQKPGNEGPCKYKPGTVNFGGSSAFVYEPEEEGHLTTSAASTWASGLSMIARRSSSFNLFLPLKWTVHFDTSNSVIITLAIHARHHPTMRTDRRADPTSAPIRGHDIIVLSTGRGRRRSDERPRRLESK
ncbi:hypothetical protein EVAR_69871_1 [Eumeta japonica]|uniref:Mos1 transposase HTH domain-containing protein n=1 Tax=Eumeta variegata TaxID=151549 RepID=A0A4C2AF11_EUMVA|nr:hypothetical protein EVAR_69871_1 [Eumeta japonica]